MYDGIEQTAEHFDISVENTKNYIKEACQILFEERSKRPRPHLDDKIVTAWNGNESWSIAVDDEWRSSSLCISRRMFCEQSLTIYLQVLW